MEKSVVIVGGQAGSKIAYDIFLRRGTHVLGFMNNYVKDGGWGKIEPRLLGSTEEEDNIRLLQREDVSYFVATGDNAMRETITENLIRSTGKHPINAIHPDTSISEFARIGLGNLICAGAVVNIGATVGNGVIINTGAVIEHDNTIEDYAQVSPNATLAGYVTVKKRAFVSSGVIVIPGITIGEDSLVAAGATVINNVEKETMVAGCPAIPKKRAVR